MAGIKLGIKLEDSKKYSVNDIKAMIGDAETRVNKEIEEKYFLKESLTADNAKEILGEDLHLKIEEKINETKETEKKAEDAIAEVIKKYGEKYKFNEEANKYAKENFGSIKDSEKLNAQLDSYRKIVKPTTDGPSPGESKEVTPSGEAGPKITKKDGVESFEM